MDVIIAIVVFLITYVFIITEKINRAVVALFGASIILALGVVNTEKAFAEYIEWNTITLLIGMMILVSILKHTGVFQYIAIRTAKAVKGKPIQILILFCVITAVASAFLDNVTTVLLMVPITFSITRMLDLNPVPFLISEILVSNIGGTATLIGDPPNIIIGSANPHLTFNDFLVNLAPAVIIILIISLSILYWIYRKQLHTTNERIQQLMEVDETEYIRNYPLMRKSLVVLGLTIIGFFLHSALHVEASVIAIMGASLLMMIGLKERDIEEAFAEVEWVSIFFFAGLFVLVGGLQETGVIGYLASLLLEATQGDIPLTASLVLWGSGIASGLIDNIPFVVTMIPLVKELAINIGFAVNSPEINALWWSLALGACLGGNATILGASANIVVINLMKREYRQSISYWEFFKIGAPITLISLILAHIYIYFRYLIHLM